MMVFTEGQILRCACVGQILKTILMFSSIAGLKRSKGYQINFHASILRLLDLSRPRFPALIHGPGPQLPAVGLHVMMTFIAFLQS